MTQDDELIMQKRMSDALDAALLRRGIADASTYLEEHGNQAKLEWSPDDVSSGGSVHLAMRATITSAEIDAELDSL